MTSAILNDNFPLKLEKSDRPSRHIQDREEKYITSGVNWQAYESFLSALGRSISAVGSRGNMVLAE